MRKVRKEEGTKKENSGEDKAEEELKKMSRQRNVTSR
jgi:hypothetical protein